MEELFDDIYVFVPSSKRIIRIAEGDGMNLLEEDIMKGYVDYIYYDEYDLCAGMHEVDGGMISLSIPFHDAYPSMNDCIPDVLEFIYGVRDVPYITLDEK